MTTRVILSGMHILRLSFPANLPSNTGELIVGLLIGSLLAGIDIDRLLPTPDTKMVRELWRKADRRTFVTPPFFMCVIQSQHLEMAGLLVRRSGNIERPWQVLSDLLPLAPVAQRTQRIVDASTIPTGEPAQPLNPRPAIVAPPDVLVPKKDG
jgi:hypothetical protein